MVTLCSPATEGVYSQENWPVPSGSMMTFLDPVGPTAFTSTSFSLVSGGQETSKVPGVLTSNDSRPGPKAVGSMDAIFEGEPAGAEELGTVGAGGGAGGGTGAAAALALLPLMSTV